MSLHLTNRQRLSILRYVADNAIDGVCPDEPQHMDGVDFGHALLTIELEGLCITEEPDYLWLTPDGEKLLEGAA